VRDGGRDGASLFGRSEDMLMVSHMIKTHAVASRRSPCSRGMADLS
jgi:hypothetical protein